MLIVRLKQAETAVADGRLDEAFEIVRSVQIRQHHRGQKLISRLAREFAKRGRTNLEAERLQLALADCNKAEKLAGNTDEIAKLRADICCQMEQKRLRNQHRSFNIDQAQRSIEDGWLSAGRQILEQAGNSGGRAGMVIRHENIARMKENEAIAKIRQALAGSDIENAIDILRLAGIANSKSEKVLELVSTIKQSAVSKIRTNFDNGRIDLASALWNRLSPVANGASEIAELGFAFEQCQKAAELLDAGRPREAANLLKKVKVIYPAAKWLDTVTEQSLKAADLLDDLSAGPLGLNFCNGSNEANKQIADSGEKETLPGISNTTAHKPNEKLPPSSDFVLQIDAVGSFLILRDNSITIGPVSSSARPDIGLIADPNLPVATIERKDDDYFLRSSGSINVNGMSINNKLLVNEDKISLSARCGMKFRIPNPASTTASLILSGSRLSRSDIGQVLLMDRDILLGPGRNNHVVAECLEEQVTIYARNDRLICKSGQEIYIDDVPAGLSAELVLDKQIRIGKLTFVLTKAGN